MRIVVPDASVLLKWVLPTEQEASVEPALRLRQAALRRRVDLRVPGLWLYEVGSALVRRLPERAGDLLDALSAFDLAEGQPTAAWRAQAVALARDYGVTFYDAAYHALAIVERGVFVTADLRYVGRAEGAGRVVPLDNWDA